VSLYLLYLILYKIDTPSIVYSRKKIFFNFLDFRTRLGHFVKWTEQQQQQFDIKDRLLIECSLKISSAVDEVVQPRRALFLTL
jgi:hypothetical protein